MSDKKELQNTLSMIPATKVSHAALFPILDEAWELRLHKQAPIPCFVGSPGIGKTQVVYQWTEARELTMVELNGSAMSPTDLVAYVPERDNRLLAEYMHQEVARCCDPKFKGVLFMDEIHQLHVEVQKPFSKLLNQRVAGSRKLSDGCMIVTAGNRASDKAGANRLLSLIANRVDTIPVEVDNEALIDLFIDYGYDDIVVAYMAARPYIESEDFQPHEPSFYTPRSFERVAAKLKSRRVSSPHAMLRLEQIASSIGIGRARDLIAFHALVDKMPTMSEIEKGPDTCKVPTKLDEMCAVSCMLSVGVDDKKFPHVAQYMQRFPISLQILFLKLTLRRLPTCRSFSGFAKWVMKPEVRAAILDKKVK